MFKWLKDKMLSGSEDEYQAGLKRNANFFHFFAMFKKHIIQKSTRNNKIATMMHFFDNE